MVAVNWIDVASGFNFEQNPRYYVGYNGALNGVVDGIGALDIGVDEQLSLISSASLQEIEFFVGSSGPDAYGTVTIDGAGAELKLSGIGISNARIAAIFGSLGHGDLFIRNGGRFYIHDTRGAEFFAVGMDGGTGSVAVTGDGSQFRMVSGAPSINVGLYTPPNNGVSQANFSVTGGASLFVQSNDPGVPGNAGMSVGNSSGSYGSAKFQGAAVGADWTAKFDATATAYLHIGDYDAGDPETTAGGVGVVNIGTGADVSLTGGTGAYIRLGRSVVSTGKLNVTGAGTTLEVFAEGGNASIDLGFDLGFALGTGRLTISDNAEVLVGAASGSAIVSIRNGSTLAGRNGKLTGDVAFISGGRADFRDNGFGRMTVTGSGDVTGSGNAAFFDVGSAGNDRITFSGDFQLIGSLAVTLNAISGYKFVKGQTKTIATFSGGDSGNGAYSATVTGQQSDFSYYFGKLGANLKNIVVVALNNGNAASAANAGVLDYGATGAGKLVYNSLTQAGAVTGGKFGVEGGHAVKLDDIRGTNGVDNFSVTGTTARVLKFDGKGGNDIIEGGAGIDTILGGIGNDTLTGNGGKDTMTGSAGSDVFKFTLKTHSSASHATADVIMDFDDGGTGDKIDISGLVGPKMTYIGAAAFTKAGQVRINDIAGADVIVEVNTGGSLAADFSIRLKGTTLAEMAANDFVL